MFRLIIVLFFIVFGNSSDENQLAWDEDYRLQWSDFKGLPQTQSDAVAITASGLSSTLSARTTETELVDFTAEIVAHFYPEKSWYKLEHVNEIVLAHEQLHFDITELHARKQRQRIAESKFTLEIKKEMAFIQQEINQELENMQNLYDSESNFSIDVGAQKKWQIYIANELGKLSEYK